MGDYGTNANQIGDTMVWQVNGRMEIECEGGYMTLTETVHSAVYLTLAGGNADDAVDEASAKKQWWGNEGEPREEQYRSRFLHACASGQPLTSNSVVTLAQAATDDLEAAFVDTKLAKAVEITEVRIPMPKRVYLSGEMTLNSGMVIPFEMEVPKE